MTTKKNIGVFVDVTSIHRTVKTALQGKLDYDKYLDKISEEGNIYRSIAYGAQVADEAFKFITYLNYIGFECKYKPAKIERTKQIFNAFIKAFNINQEDNLYTLLSNKMEECDKTFPSIYNTDILVGMISDILRMLPRLDIIVLGTSNPEIAPFVEYLREQGLYVIIFSSKIPGDLKRVANRWIEISTDELEEKKEEYEASEAT